LTGKDEKPNELAQSGRGYNIFGQPKANLEIPTWRPNASTPAIVASAVGRAQPMMNAVGGSSIHYGTMSFRLNPWNFKMRSETVKRYGAHAVPAGSTLADWPLTYEELEPYYDKTEYEIGISGKAGNISGKLDPAGNIFEGARSREYPLPPLRKSGYTELMTEAAKRVGWHPFPLPSSVHSRPFKGTPACTYCGFCENGCFINAKGSTNMHVIPAAEATRRLSVVTEARVTQINTDNNGRVTGVLYLKDGKEFFQPASVVMLATFTYENTRLLFLSTSKAYPKGLSNNHGQVGKNYMCNNIVQNSRGLFPGRKLNRASGLHAQATTFGDWADDNFDHTGLGFIGGAQILAGMGETPIVLPGVTPPGVPTWGSAWKAWLKANANSLGEASGECEGLPYEDYYLDLDPTTRDRLGLPVIRITYDFKDNEYRLNRFITDKISMWLKEAGATQTWANPATPTVHPLANHAFGGARMGTDPEASVVDRWCFSHEAPNLAVLGGATFPTSSSLHPTLTIQAMAWRTADHLVENWKSIAT
jgi:gluconate 2-dehydrogenase alpha chain